MKNARHLQIRCNDDLIQKLDELRMGRIDFPSRAQIVREAVEAAHTAKEKTPEAGTSRV